MTKLTPRTLWGMMFARGFTAGRLGGPNLHRRHYGIRRWSPFDRSSRGAK